ncbi:PD-(D/E)XK nuclease-like domain-containing protein [Weissella ceti]|uniref:Putative exodeoxyribonuclease 8 PDDEXK-like domain-containing protein n=1 Tax=Weissella ceti TaxID=759620 RepID=A0A088GLG2_9LACO|nr:PD-(D/E)XK nuclease-like domain-containing protein [Weissella ceti]AIM63097.1 hypothetical protein WS74_0845 [Weissella ceti]
MTEKIHMSPTRVFKFMKNPARALDDYHGIYPWWEGDNTPLLYGTMVHNLAEGAKATFGFTEDELSQVVSSAGKTKGQIKATYKEAEFVGQALCEYVENNINGPRTFEQVIEIEDTTEDEHAIDVLLTGRADLVTDNAVYDFKTVAGQDFDGFIKYGSFRDERQLEYMMQVTYYAMVLGKKEAHIIYVKKHKDTPFIYDYKLTTEDMYDAWSKYQYELGKAIEIVAGVRDADAINDGSQWAYKKFGGVIDASEVK